MEHGTIKPVDASLTVAIVSSYPPRPCGVAVVAEGLASVLPREDIQPWIAAVNEQGARYEYGPEVVWQFREDAVEDYQRVAAAINHSGVDVVNLQHEFAIYGEHEFNEGGEWTDHIIEFVNRLEVPLVTTLQTVSPQPNRPARHIVRTLCERSAFAVVFSPPAARILVDRYDVPPSRIRVIWVGAPEIEPLPRERAKQALGLEGRLILATFGFMAPDKGVEDLLEGLPAVVRQYPNVLCLLLGPTHPAYQRSWKDDYVARLMAQVRALKLDAHVRFENRYMRSSEIVPYLQATDICVIPYRDREELGSGALSWAMAAGCAVVSTPFLYAQDVLANGKGVLTPFRSPQALSLAINDLASDSERRQIMGEQARRFARQMEWREVGKQYAVLFRQVAHRTSSSEPNN